MKEHSFNIKYEGTSRTLLRQNKKCLGRKSDMSFVCYLKNKNGIVLCSDSRELFENHQINEHRQKLFISDDQIVYGCTGLAKYKNEDCVFKVNKIMNKKTTYKDRISEIKKIMSQYTLREHNENNVYSRFDIFLIVDNQLHILSIKDGYIEDDSELSDYPDIETMGRQVHLFTYFPKEDYENDTLEQLLEKGKLLVHKAAQLESLEKYPSINNIVQWMIIDNRGTIQTNL